jgi:hypothetical protein
MDLRILLTTWSPVWLEEIVDELPGYQSVTGARVSWAACCTSQLPGLIFCLLNLLLLLILNQLPPAFPALPCLLSCLQDAFGHQLFTTVWLEPDRDLIAHADDCLTPVQTEPFWLSYLSG